jgi:hypothetical protein
MPQGAPFNDSQDSGDNCSPGFPFHFDLFVPSNVLKLNYGKLSFFLRAFRAPVSAVNNGAVTSGAGAAHSHGITGQTTDSSLTAHTHGILISSPAAGSPMSNNAAGALSSATGATGGTVNANVPHTHTITGWTTVAESVHTHTVTSSVTLIYGIFEGAVATGVTVIINGTDRTSALGGGSGFTTNQTELEIGQWLTIGAWNTIDLTPTGLGRIGGHLRVTGYIQSN